MTSTEPGSLPNLEERKLKEIEHSRQRRTILQGFERRTDAHPDDQVQNMDSLVRDREAFEKHYSNMKFYAIAKSSEAYYFDWIRERCEGRTALDYCCGNGEHALFMAQNGAKVFGIDISPEGIANCQRNAVAQGVANRTEFVVMDGEAMTFADATFDLIVVYGALHHLEYERAMSELSRVLKPDGEIICIEALRHNPLIHLYRKMTRHLRTEWEVEHILGVESLDISRQYFESVEARFFHLLSLGAVPFRKTPLFAPMLRFLEGLDGLLLRRPSIGKFAWMMIFVLSKPRQRPLAGKKAG